MAKGLSRDFRFLIYFLGKLYTSRPFRVNLDRGPRNPDHLLHPGELRAAFPNLTHLFYREWISCSAVPQSGSGTSGEAMASLLARKPSRQRS